MESTVPTFYDTLAQWSEIVGGFAFIVVAVLLFRKYVSPAVRAGQIARNSDLVDAEHRRDALKADVSKARAELEAADRDAAAIKARAAGDAGRERDRLIADATAEGERAVASAQGELDRARLVAQAHLRTEFVARALESARAKAGERIDSATNTRLVHGTVETLVREPAGSNG